MASQGHGRPRVFCGVVFLVSLVGLQSLGWHQALAFSTRGMSPEGEQSASRHLRDPVVASNGVSQGSSRMPPLSKQTPFVLAASSRAPLVLSAVVVQAAACRDRSATVRVQEESARFCL